MKTILLTIVLNMVAVSALAVTPLKEKYTNKDFPSVLGANDVMFRIQTVQQYLDWIDLKAVYLDETREGGAPGFFLAIPKVAGPHSTPRNTTLEEEDQMDAIGYYFKAGTGQTLDGTYDNSASARPGSTGGTYTCFKDAKASTAEIDVLSFNQTEFNKATTSLEKLQALAIGLRYTPLGDGTGDIQVACWGGQVIPVFSPYPADPVQTYAIFRDYEDGDEETRKADGFDVYGRNFGGHFVWEKSKGEMTNGQVLIDIYKELGYEYED